MDRVVVTRAVVGVLHMQVCAAKDATDEEVLAVCNTKNPAGTSLGWATVVRDGDGGPVLCKDDPERLHLLVAC